VSFNFREDLLNVSEKHFEAYIEKHRINIEVLLENNVGLAEHSDIMDTIEKEMGLMADYHDKLEVLRTYFIKENKKEVLNG